LALAEIEYETTVPFGPVASAETGPGTAVNVGGWLSTNLTTTWNVPVPVFPLGSVALHVTMVDPTANVVPAAGVHVPRIEPPTASDADGTSYVTVVPPVSVVVRATSASDPNLGAVVSRTVTVPVAVVGSVVGSVSSLI
jgi:hypothetical protein